MKKTIKRWLDIDDLEIGLSVSDTGVKTAIKNEVNIAEIQAELKQLRTEVSLLRATNEHMQKLVQDMKLNDLENKRSKAVDYVNKIKASQKEEFIEPKPVSISFDIGGIDIKPKNKGGRPKGKSK